MRLLTAPGLYADGNNLYLQVTAAGVRSWVFRYMLHGRRRTMGLGTLAAVSLKSARDLAFHCHELLRAGVDPIEDRKQRRAAALVATVRTITFDQAAAQYIESQAPGWRNPKHVDQWRTTLARYASPVFGKLPVAEIDTGLVLRVLEPIWTTKTATATRLRGRIENVLGWATVRGYRTGDNPARWTGHLSEALPKPATVHAKRHHPALPYAELPEFMRAVRAQEGVAPRLLEFTILTAARTNETAGARWDEVDLDAAIWTVPPERLKGRANSTRAHRVPLSKPAVRLLQALKGYDDVYVFPGRPNQPISNNGMLALLKRMGRADITVHGFRSTFRDWSAERTAYPRDVCEMALAHTIRDHTEAAYRRGDLLDKRRRLMADWARFIDTPAGKVTPLRRARSG